MRPPADCQLRYALQLYCMSEIDMYRQISTPRYLFGIALLSAIGCNQQSPEPHIVAEGIIYSLEYKLEDGKSGGFTRLNHRIAVPGGNGRWNVDAYGRLTNEYLIITYPQRKRLGARVIPARRLMDLQFGDGGIKTVDENKTAPAG